MKQSEPKAPQAAAGTALEAVLGYRFEARDRLDHALTHPSLEGAHNYQRLEFLGDRVLGLVIADALLERFPDEREGILTRRLINLVRKEAIAGVAMRIGLGADVKMTATTEAGGGRENPAVLSDVLEAIIGAVFLDGGFEAASDVIRKLWEPALAGGDLAEKDAKSALQEWAQGRGFAPPGYTQEGREGPDHAPTFVIRVEIPGQGDAEASGPSKRAAEQDAAASLLARLSKDETQS